MDPEAVPVPLSPRERAVLSRLAAGEPQREAARGIGISVGTLREYLKRAQAKLGTRGLAQTVAAASGQIGPGETRRTLAGEP